MALANYLDKQIQARIQPTPDSFWPTFIDWKESKKSKRTVRKELVKSFYVGISVFVLLESSAFRTAFPSSVIAPGVFANCINVYKNSIPATGDVATEAQRAKIQRLGNLFGCHQCGSRQYFTKETFIADHMPPTKFANAMNARWWRRLFHIEVRQQLLFISWYCLY